MKIPSRLDENGFPKRSETFSRMGGKPTDLVDLREAEKLTAISGRTIHNWITLGKGGSKLHTYRKPGEAETMLVSLAEVQRFDRIKARQQSRSIAGGLGIRLRDEDACRLRHLSALMTTRIGATISYMEALRGAVANAIRNEELRLAQKTPNPQQPIGE